MRPAVLITGGAGFLGLACARRFERGGWSVIGVGRGEMVDCAAQEAGYDQWVVGSLTSKKFCARLLSMGLKLSAVVHCAGNSSVPNSFERPLASFEQTVQATANLLDQLRKNEPNALVLYPSSAAVYGESPDRRIDEESVCNPVSPYGFQKLMVENLLAQHAVCFGQKAIAVRFFSIYGCGLRKQLLWDASNRLLAGDHQVVFHGTGGETRDWIHVNDAADLICHLANQALAKSISGNGLEVVNGGSGERVEVQSVLKKLADVLEVNAGIVFNGYVREGDPRFYCACTAKLGDIGWAPSISLDQGLQEYSRWIKAIV